MAVQNKYVNAAYDVNGFVVNPPGTLSQWQSNGAEMCSLYQAFSIAAADSNGSVYRIFKALDPNIIPVRLMLANQAMAGTTSIHLGLYKTNSAAGFGAIVGTGDQFATAQSLNGARTSLMPGTALDGLGNLPQFTRTRRLFEIAGETEVAPTIATTRVDGFDLCLTLNTTGGVLGQVEVLFEFVQG